MITALDHIHFAIKLFKNQQVKTNLLKQYFYQQPLLAELEKLADMNSPSPEFISPSISDNEVFYKLQIAYLLKMFAKEKTLDNLYILDYLRFNVINIDHFVSFFDNAAIQQMLNYTGFELAKPQYGQKLLAFYRLFLKCLNISFSEKQKRFTFQFEKGRKLELSEDNIHLIINKINSFDNGAQKSSFLYQQLSAIS